MRAQNLSLLIARIPPKVMLLVMTGLAISAGVLVEQEMQKRDKLLADQQTKNAQKDMAQVLVATREIPEGSAISADEFKIDTVESSRVPVGALQTASSAYGMQARTTIHQGDSILSQSVQAPQAPKGFETKIKTGFRAITFPVDSSTGVAGFLGPDCRVDILAQTGSGAEAKAIPILSDVQVVAVGQTYQKKSGVDEAQNASSVTVAVLPEDGQKLINAMSAGKLYCLMRNQVDHAPLAVRDLNTMFPKIKSPVNDQAELSQVPPLPAPVLPVVPSLSSGASDSPLPRPLHNVEIWSANKKDALSFPD